MYFICRYTEEYEHIPWLRNTAVGNYRIAQDPRKVSTRLQGFASVQMCSKQLQSADCSRKTAIHGTNCTDMSCLNMVKRNILLKMPQQLHRFIIAK
jgi:hypothetical protein